VFQLSLSLRIIVIAVHREVVAARSRHERDLYGALAGAGFLRRGRQRDFLNRVETAGC
jgi:hypothetical protein